MKAKILVTLFLVVVILVNSGLPIAVAQIPNPVTPPPLPGQPGAPVSPEKIVPMEVKEQNEVVPEFKKTNENKRIQWMSDHLGVPKADLEKMSSGELYELRKTNAGKLGISIFEWDDELKDYKQVAGTSKSLVKPAGTPVPTSYIYLPIITKNPLPTPTSTVPPYPIVTSTPTRTRTPSPTPTQTPIGFSVGQALIQLSAAKSYMDALYSEDGNYGFISEYVGYPLAIVNNTRTDYTYPRFTGEYQQKIAGSCGNALGKCALGKVLAYETSSTFDWMTITFEDWQDWNYGNPTVFADRYYYDNGTTQYAIGWDTGTGGSTDNIDVYFADTKIIENIINNGMGATWTWMSPVGFRENTSRYMARIGGAMGRATYGWYGDTDKAKKIGNMLKTYGYNYDYYYPFFNYKSWVRDDAEFNNMSYPDCDLSNNNGVNTVQPRGLFPHRYPYESKVCTQRDAWIALSRQDYIATGLQAIHILNKYNNPDKSYPDPRPQNIGQNTTARQIARSYETPADGLVFGAWNGNGIRYYGKDAVYSSGLRTDIFLVLETLLCTKFGDSTSCGFADTVANQMMTRVWGTGQFTQYKANVIGMGQYLRPPYQGAPFLAWKPGSGFQFGVVPGNIVVNLVYDLLNMPDEVKDLGPVSVSETTMTYINALRIYMHFRHGVDLVNQNGQSTRQALPYGDYRWISGWNLVALPQAPIGTYYAGNLLQDADAAGCGIMSINRLQNGTWDPYVPGSNNFALETQRGYMIYANNPCVFRLPSTQFVAAAPTQRTLSVGDNSVGYFGGDEAMPFHSASTYLAKLASSGCNPSQISRWFNNEWLPYAYRDTTNDFPIEIDEGYIVYVFTTCLVNPNQ